MIIEANTSVSHGTMRNADLLYSFGTLLSVLGAANEKHFMLAQEATALVAAEQTNSWQADEAVTELFDALNEYAPDGCYFGSHPGDGADYGFWTNEND